MRPPAGQFAAWGSEIPEPAVGSTEAVLIEATLPVPVVWRVFFVNTTGNGVEVFTRVGLGRVSIEMATVTVPANDSLSFEVPARQLVVRAEVGAAGGSGALAAFAAPIAWPWGVDPEDAT